MDGLSIRQRLFAFVSSWRGRAVTAGALLAAAALGLLLEARSGDAPVHKVVAYVGRYANVDFDKMHEVALGHYLDDFNRRSENLRLELETFDIGDDPQRSLRAYTSTLSGDDQILAVIDNTWGKHIQAVATEIRNKNIPVIAINADRQEIDFGNNVLFLGHEDTVPQTLAAFVAQALGDLPVLLIAEDDYRLSRVFADELARVGAPPDRVLSVPSANFESTRWSSLQAELTRELSGATPPLVVLSMHRYWGNEIIRFLDTSFRGVTVLVSPSAISSEMGTFGDNDHGNRLIVMTRPADTLSKRVRTDIESFERDYPEYFAGNRYNKPLFVRRSLDAVSILDAAISWQARGKKPEEVTRTDLLSYFRGLADGFLDIGHDLLAFDSNLMLLKESQFEVHEAGLVQSYQDQLNSRLEVIPNIQFGLDILNISDIDPGQGTFHAEFYYWLRMKKTDSDLERPIHFRNLRRREEQSLLLEREENGFLYRLYKISGEFQADFDLRDFPLDEQELVLQLDLVHDTDSVRVSFDREGFEASRNRAEGFKIRAWKILDYYTTVDNDVASSLRGADPMRPNVPQKFQSVNVRLRVQRRPLGPFVTFILPLAMIGLAGISVLQLRDVSFRNIGEVCVVIFLSIVTYSIAFAEFKPESSVLTKADMLFYATFLAVLLVFLTVILLGSVYGPEELTESRARRTRWIGRLIGVLYLAALVVIPLL
jgi:hypothetical protein